MKRIFIIAGVVGGLFACNNSSDNKGPGSDTPDHSVHNPANAAGGSDAIIDTSSLSGKSMMSIMHTNMDQMKAMSSTGNPDNDFASLMKVHHMGAIEMSELELAKGTDPEVKGMAQKMLNDQQKEIADINSFLAAHSPHGGGEGFHKEVMKQMSKMNMNMDHGGSVDKQFVQMMIPHHRGAIDMANAYLKADAHEEKLKIMAKNIIKEQQKEIRALEALLAKNK